MYKYYPIAASLGYTTMASMPFLVSTGIGSLMSIFWVLQIRRGRSLIARIYLMNTLGVVRFLLASGKEFDVPISAVSEILYSNRGGGVLNLKVQGEVMQLEMGMSSLYDPWFLYAVTRPTVN